MKNIVKKLGTTFLVVSGYALTSGNAFAAFEGSKGLMTGLDEIAGGDGDLLEIAVTALNWVTGLVALAAVAVLIFSGIKYVTSNGDEKKVEEANKGIINAVIGLAICFLAALVVNFVVKQLDNFTGGGATE